MTTPTGKLVGGVVVRRKPMKLEVGEPVRGVSWAVVLTFKCPSCGVAKKIKRARNPALVRR